MMASQTEKTVLWVDDDPRERFAYEEEILTTTYGFHLTWATTITSAARALARKPFDVVLLDQMFPWGTEHDTPDVWSGCKLLYWLRGTSFTAASCPWGWSDDTATFKKALRYPRKVNRTIPVIVMSAYADVDVAAALSTASTQDKNIPMLSKPVDIPELLMRLGLTQ